MKPARQLAALAALVALAATVLLALGATSAAARGQEQKDPRQPAPPKRNLEWPPLKFVRKSLARDAISRLASRKPDKAEKARQLILSYGAGVCPVLLDAMSPRRDQDTIDRIRSLLDEILQPEHAWPLTTAYGGKNPVRNLWVVEKLASWEKKELTSFFRKAAGDKDAAVAEGAKFGLARLGEPDMLPFLHELAKTQWAEKNYPIRRALLALKGKEATDWLMSKLTEEALPSKVATLRLLGGAGTRDAVSAIATYLNAKEHQLRAGAVNALRGIVDGDPPFRHLSVFQAIDEVKKWKQRLGR